MKNNIILVVLIFLIVLISGCGDNNKIGQPDRSSSLSLQHTQDDLLKITTRLPETAFGGVDVINETVLPKQGSVVNVKGDKLLIAGNYVDAVRGEAAAGVIVLIDKKMFVAQYGGERPDIAKALHNPKYLKSQFSVTLPVSDLAKGSHDLRIRVVASDRSGYFESPLLVKLNI